MAKKHFLLVKPHVTIGTIGHIGYGKTGLLFTTLSPRDPT